MVFRRSVLSCGLKNKTSPISTRRKGAVCKTSVLLSGLRRRNSSRHTRKRRATCKVSAQRCTLRKRHCCRNRSSWRKTLPGQCTKLRYQELSFTPTFLTRLTLLQQFCYTVYHTPLFVWSFPYWTQCYFVSGSSRSQNAELNNGIKALEISQQELEKRLAALQLQHQQDSTKLQTQLDEADSRSKTLQREVYSQTKKSFTKCQAPQNHPLFLRLRILLPSDLTVALCLHLLRFGHIFHSCNWLTDIVPL